MRGAAARLLAIAAAVVAAAAPAPPSAAQASPRVQTFLRSQTPWNTPKADRFEIRVLVQNLGEEELEDATLGLTLFGALPTRTHYQRSLAEDVGSPIAQAPLPAGPSNVSLPPGERVPMKASMPVGFLENQASEARIYPLKVEIVSGGLVAGEMRTPLIFLPEPPELPLSVTRIAVLSGGLSVGPDGVFESRAFEHQVTADGGLRGVVDALYRGRTGGALDLAVDPLLVEQLELMRDDYRVRTANGVERPGPESPPSHEAGVMLTRLSEIAVSERVATSALPFGAAPPSALIDARIGADIALQLELGRRTVGRLGAGSPGSLRPPRSDIGERALSRLRTLGVRIVFPDPHVVEMPRQPKDFAPPPAARLPAGPAGVVAVVPEPLASSLNAPGDPRLTAQWVLGDLAAIWLEQPDVDRGAALLVTHPGYPWDDPAPFWQVMAGTLPDAPWIRTRPAASLVADFPPVRPRRIRSVPWRYEPGYAEGIRETRALLARYRSILPDPAGDDLADSAQRAVFVAEGLIDRRQVGNDWLGWANAAIGSRFAGIHPVESQTFTLTSQTGSVPVRVANDSGQPVNVAVRLASNRLETVEGNPRPLSLAAGETTTLGFEVESRTTGTFPVQVLIETPSGEVINEGRIVVRSTAFNRVALLITMAALLVLVVLWGRRFASRTRRS